MSTPEHEIRADGQNIFQQFLASEAAGGILLIGAAIAALVLVNSPGSGLYDQFLNVPVSVAVGSFAIAKPLLLWINDGLMAVFFFLIGLEVKREVLEGSLRHPSQIALPAIGAIGGMAIPAAIYVAINAGNPSAMAGWAIPTATDVAFALGILALLGDRVPNTLKIFLLTLAIFDDLGAIVIIALFYSGELSTTSLWVAAGALITLVIMNRRGVTRFAPYLFVGLILWTSVLKSGVHATLAGVLFAFTIPNSPPPGQTRSLLHSVEHDLHPWVAFFILPCFAFANAGVSFAGLTWDDLMSPISLGIAAGLFIGKQIGIFGFSWVAIRVGFAKMPAGANWMSLYGIAMLCGIGFTMSLFIGSLAFEETAGENIVADRVGILLGTIMSAIAGFFVLKYALRKSHLAPKNKQGSDSPA